jgi:hypothetical protein
MVSRSIPSSRTRLIARFRVYLAALITGGVATGAGLTVAAAHADTATAAKQHTATGQQSTHRARGAHHATRTASSKAPSKAPSSPVRSASSSPSSSPSSSASSQRAGSSHAS